MSDSSALSAGDSPEYIDALLGYLGDRDPIEVFASTEKALREAVEPMDEAVLRTPEAPGKWSIIDVMKHLADVEIVLGFRYRKVLGEDTPEISAIDQDAWVTNLRYREAKLADTLDDFAAVRNVNLRLLRSLDTEQLERSGMHSQRGKETMETMIRLYAAHDLYHLYQIKRIRQAVQK